MLKTTKLHKKSVRNSKRTVLATTKAALGLKRPSKVKKPPMKKKQLVFKSHTPYPNLQQTSRFLVKKKVLHPYYMSPRKPLVQPPMAVSEASMSVSASINLSYRSFLYDWFKQRRIRKKVRARSGAFHRVRTDRDRGYRSQRFVFSRRTSLKKAWIGVIALKRFKRLPYGQPWWDAARKRLAKMTLPDRHLLPKQTYLTHQSYIRCQPKRLLTPKHLLPTSRSLRSVYSKDHPVPTTSTTFAREKKEPWFFKFKFKQDIPDEEPRVSWFFKGSRYLTPPPTNHKVVLYLQRLRARKVSKRVIKRTRTRIRQIKFRPKIYGTVRALVDSDLRRTIARARRLRYHPRGFNFKRALRWRRHRLLKRTLRIFGRASKHLRKQIKVYKVFKWYDWATPKRTDFSFERRKELNWWWRHPRWCKLHAKRLYRRHDSLRKYWSRRSQIQRRKKKRKYLMRRSYYLNRSLRRIKLYSYCNKQITDVTLTRPLHWTYLFAGENEANEFCSWAEAREEDEFWEVTNGERWRLPRKIARACLPTKHEYFGADEDEAGLYIAGQPSWWHLTYKTIVQRKTYVKQRQFLHIPLTYATTGWVAKRIRTFRLLHLTSRYRKQLRAGGKRAWTKVQTARRIKKLVQQRHLLHLGTLPRNSLKIRKMVTWWVKATTIQKLKLFAPHITNKTTSVRNNNTLVNPPTLPQQVVKGRVLLLSHELGLHKNGNTVVGQYNPPYNIYV